MIFSFPGLITQDVPLWSNMALVEGNFEGRIPIEKLRNLIEGWEYIFSPGIGSIHSAIQSTTHGI